MTHCPKCGTQVPGSFCPNCGAQVTAPVQQVAAANQVPPLPHNPPSPPQQPYGAPGYYPAPQKKGMGVGKILLIVVGVIIALFAVLVIIGSLLPDEETTPTSTTPTSSAAKPLGILTGPVITDKVDNQSQEPLTAMKATLPTSTGEIYASVEINLKAGQKLSARWYYTGRLQDHLTTTLDIPNDFQGWASFNISNGNKPWPKGQYKVEILVDGAKAAETTFSVN